MMTHNLKLIILSIILTFNSFLVMGQHSDEGIQWLIGIETRNDFVASTGVAYAWADGSTITTGEFRLNSIYLTYGYGLGDGSSTISTAISRTYMLFPFKLELNYTLLDEKQDFSIEPSFGFGVLSAAEILVGYNVKLTNNIENYPSRFNLTLNINPIGLFSN